MDTQTVVIVGWSERREGMWGRTFSRVSFEQGFFAGEIDEFYMSPYYKTLDEIVSGLRNSTTPPAMEALGRA